ncbi:TRAP transporter small permease subunit [Bowmanella sp. Y57]|uniref:TRAP transporter small permease protein n=1 Tax=Bowmanella yangjiangensis TaxID=2811230 RepID=A0ABS3CT97_9ALTE|nr:TRAP transporter small permease subunit [Bowmanella yangjiangensis]MBN7819505.1 TRAP transporter small permease subunit [Bowmanella yangjiangensis]
MVVLVFTIVLLRYGFNLGWIAMQESAMYLHAAVFMLGCAHTLKADEHVRVDIFYRNWSAKTRAMIDLAGALFLLLPVNIFIFFMSWDYVATSWRLLEDSPEAGGLPLVFLLKSLIPLFCLTMSLQALAQSWINWRVLGGSSLPSSQEPG